MGDAKSLVVKPISAADANRVIERLHYSGKSVNNSQLHFGVFMDGKCGGAMSFGPSMDKRKVQGLVAGTLWNEFIELNRMAFADWLPRNGESRCIGYALRFIRKRYPQIKWVVSFSDGAQCGDGTIYRASGFVLTNIGKNKTLLQFPDGTRVSNLTLTASWDCPSVHAICKMLGVPVTYRNLTQWKALGAKEIDGFQLRYVYFIDPSCKKNLTCPILPFSDIDKHGAGMYKGVRRKQSGASSAEGGTSGNQPEGGGSNPTDALHL